MANSSRSLLSVRWIPWLLALVGLATPAIGSGFGVWIPSAVWLALLAVAWLLSRIPVPRSRDARIAVAIALLPVLFLAAWEGGWYLLPADLAWLAIEVADRGPAPDVAPPGNTVSGPR